MSSGLFIGSGFKSGVILVPRDDQEFVAQATRPIYEVLGLEKDKCCSHIQWLDKDHQGISEMCKKALDPVIVKKTNQDYFYSILTFAILAAGAGLVLSFLKSGSLKTHLLIPAVLGIGGAIFGWKRVYSVKEENMKKTEITLKATAERTWLKSKLPQIEEKLKVAEEKIEKFQLDDFDKKDNKDATALRDQLLLLKSYVTSAVGRHG